MADFSKITDHPEFKEIVSKLVSGDNPKVVSKYLKEKYKKPDESHLRIPATLLQEFLESYADHHKYVQKIVQRNTDSKLEKKIADSLMDTASWKERIERGVEKEFEYIDRLDNILTILETRAEQIFDKIQDNPEDTRADYVFTKYMEILMTAIEKADKIRNDKPDVKIEHTYTVQMVEQQSAAFQEAIIKVLERLGPEYSSMFLDLLNEELSGLNAKKALDLPTNNNVKKLTEKRYSELDKLDAKANEFNQKFMEDDEEDDE